MAAPKPVDLVVDSLIRAFVAETRGEFDIRDLRRYLVERGLPEDVARRTVRNWARREDYVPKSKFGGA